MYYHEALTCKPEQSQLHTICVRFGRIHNNNSNHRFTTIIQLNLRSPAPPARVLFNTHTRLHTHTHLFNCPFSVTIQVSRYQKGKTNLDFTETRDSHPTAQFFTGRMPFLPPNQQRQSTEGKVWLKWTNINPDAHKFIFPYVTTYPTRKIILLMI